MGITYPTKGISQPLNKLKINEVKIYSNNSGRLNFFTGSPVKGGYLDPNNAVANIDFTGQHRALLNNNINNQKILKTIGS